MTEISIKKEDLLQIGTDDCIKFDKLILRKTWRRKVASEQKCQSGVDVLNFHKIADCNKLFSHSQMCDLDLVWSRSLPCFSPYKFLWVHLGMLSVNCFSPSFRLLVPLPDPMAPSFKHSASASHREGKFFIGVMKHTSTLEPKLRWARSRKARNLPASFQSF